MKPVKVHALKFILTIALMIATGSAIVFAAFATLQLGSIRGSTDNIIATVDFSSSASGGACFDVAGNACSNLLAAPGNQYSVDVQVSNYDPATSTNTNDRGMGYDFSFELVEDSIVKQAILVYIDGVFYDTLGAITSDPSHRTPTIGYLLPGQTSPIHRITFEYHIGAVSAYANEKLSLRVKANYRTLVREQATMVGSFDDVVDSNNHLITAGIKRIAEATQSALYANTRIILAANISIDETIAFHQPVTIDTNGFDLTIATGQKIEFLGEGVNQILGQGQLLGDGLIEINASNGVLLTSHDYGHYQFTQYNLALLQDMYRNYIDGLVVGGIYQAFSYVSDLFYPYSISATIPAGSSAYLSQDTLTKTIVPTQQNNTVLAHLTIEGIVQGTPIDLFDDDIQVLGTSSEVYLDSMIAQELAYLQNEPHIGYSVFLPTKFRNASSSSITWFSDNTAILDANGVFTKPVSDTTLTLTSVMVVNDQVHVRDFEITALGMTYPEKVKFLVSSYGEIHFDQLDVVVDLPTASDYIDYVQGVDLGITDITYTLDTLEYPFLSLLTPSQLTITDYTSVGFATIQMNVTFGSSGTFNQNISIGITLVPPSGMLDYLSIYQFISASFPDEDVILSFQLPTYYLAEIDYWIPDSNPNNGDSYPIYIVDGVEIINSAIANTIVGSGSSIIDGYVNINTNKVPMEDTTVYVVILVGTEKRVVSFDISGVLHTSFTGALPEEVEIPSVVLFNAIRAQLYQNVPTDTNYILRKVLYDTYYRTATTTLELIKSTNAQDVTSLQGLQYFTYLTDLRINVATTTTGTKVAGLNNNSFSDTQYISNLTNLTQVQMMYASITTIASWTRLTNVGILNLKGNTNLMYIYSLESWTGALYELDVRGSSINPTLSTSILSYSFVRSWDLWKLNNASNPTYRYGTSLTDTWTVFSPNTNGNYLASKRAADLLNGIPDTIYTSLLIPSGNFDGITLNSNGYQWTRDTASSTYISFTSTGGLSWRANILARPVNDTILVITVTCNTTASNNFAIRRTFFITLKGTG